MKETKAEQPQEGKLRLWYNIGENWYWIRPANSVLTTGIVNEVEYFNTVDEAESRVIELGLPLNAEDVTL